VQVLYFHCGYLIKLEYLSQIGTVMLIGLVTKNGILIVEFANQLREQGKPLKLFLKLQKPV
jgi:multidrug efflux pump subunit AcrB